MKTTLLLAALLIAAALAPAFADNPSYPVASGPAVMAPGDGAIVGHNPTSVQGHCGSPNVRNG
jgi:hypothetical protein